MGDVKPWSAEVGIDDQFGWNDFLITGEVSKGGDMTIKPLDHFTEATVKEISKNSKGFPTVEQFKSNPMFRPGDQIFQYGKDGPLIVRRSIFTDECTKIEPNFLYQFQSEDEVRAFAAFSGGKAHDESWCGAEVQGLKSESSTRTPWDLSTLAGLKEMKNTLEAIKAAKKDHSKDKLGLAADFDQKRLDAIEKDLDHRMSLLEPAWYDTISLLPGIGFALGGGIIGGLWLILKLVASRIGKDKDGGDDDSKGGGSKGPQPPETLPNVPDLEVPGQSNRQVMGFVDFLNESDGDLLEASKNAVKPSPATASAPAGTHGSPSLASRPVLAPPVVRAPAPIRVPVPARVIP